MFIIEDISLDQLAILGITEEYQLMFVLIAGICSLYVCMKPIILFLHYRHYTIVLTFLMSSLITFSLLSLFVLMKKDMSIFQIGFQSMAFFGLILAVFNICKQWKNTHRV